jgi:hypothetical protein
VEARTNSTGNCPPPGRAGGITGNTWMPGDGLEALLHLRQDLEHGPLALVPRLQARAAEAEGGAGDLEAVLGLGDWKKTRSPPR